MISDELIVRKYGDFLFKSMVVKERSSTLVLHTGSICFDIVSIIMAALACVSLDWTDPDAILAALNTGDLILFENQRYRWLGLDIKNGTKRFGIIQDGRGKDGPLTRWLPMDENKGRVKPYYGSATVTDGRGIPKKRSYRSEFIATVTGKNAADIPGITRVSAVIVTERTMFDRLQKGILVEYGEERKIGLLDIVPASYYTEGGESYQFGRNPIKTEPVLKIANKISVARDLVLDKQYYPAVGLVVLGNDAASKGPSDLADLLDRRTLKFTHLSMPLDAGNAEDYVGAKNPEVFACTKEFLLRNSFPVAAQNSITLELEKQIDNIVNNEMVVEIVDGGCSWEVYREIRHALHVIRHSEWEEEYKRDFVILAYSLLNLFITAVFPMDVLELAVTNNTLQFRVSSPLARIDELWRLAEGADHLELPCISVVASLDDCYKSILRVSPKYQALRKTVLGASEAITAIIIPKAYYADILLSDPMFSQDNIFIMTANRFDSSKDYDKIIVVGDFSGKRFDAFRCKSSANIFMLLYGCEMYPYEYQRRKAAEFEKRLNTISGPGDEFMDEDLAADGLDEPPIEQFVGESRDLQTYIDSVSIRDMRRFALDVSIGSEHTIGAEVTASAKFVSGERIMFSKYYKAVVYNPLKLTGTIAEIDVENLSVGDRLVFAKRDDFTKNIVDNIYEALQTSGKLSAGVLDATEKAQWWKNVLQDYRRIHSLSYGELAKALAAFGSSVTETTVRRWLSEGSHTVGPRAESTLRQIGEMAGDTYLLADALGYFNACRIVRSQRKKILGLIGKVIEDKLSGRKPISGSELEIVYRNVGNLSDVLELETVTFLAEPIMVPVNLVNRPILDGGAAL